MNKRQVKIWAALTFLSFLFCYLEWGNHNGFGFIFQLEYTILFRKGPSRDSFTHPAILLPFTGQLLLGYTVLARTPKKPLVWSGLALLSVLVLFISFIGLMALDLKIFGSTLPFLVSGFMLIRSLKNKQSVL